MIYRIEVGFKPGIRDALGEKTQRKIIEHLGINVESVETVEIYTVEGNMTGEDAERIARGPLSDPVIQQCAIKRCLAKDFAWLIEVGFRPGVTDNVGKTARKQ